MALLVACGNLICGNSAIVAVAPMIGADGEDVPSAIAFTAVLGVLMVLGLPLAATALHLTALQGGVLAATAPLGAAAVRQHVTRAAEALNLAQSAVSASVAGLESQYRISIPPGRTWDRVDQGWHAVPRRSARRIGARRRGRVGAGAAALSTSVVAGSLEAGLLHHVSFQLPARSFRVLRHRQQHRSRAADALMSLIGGG